MHQTLIPLCEENEWKSVLANVPHAFGHTFENCRAMQLAHGMETYLYHFSDQDVHIVCPIAERTYKGTADIVTPNGFSGFAGNKIHPGFPEHWRRFVIKRGYICGYIGLNSILEQKVFFPDEPVYSHNNLYALDLTLTEDQLLNNFSSGRRAQVKNHEQQLHAFTEDKSLLKEFFLENYYAFFSRLNARQMLDFSSESLSELLDSSNVILTGRLSDGNIQAVSVFGYTGHIAVYLFNISLPEGRQYAVPLLWQGIRILKEKNIPVLNLGGGVKKDDSIAKFKERFGAKCYPLTSLKQIYNADTYQELCERAGVESGDLNGFFPAYHSPGLQENYK
jgi:hypothetical protein